MVLQSVTISDVIIDFSIYFETGLERKRSRSKVASSSVNSSAAILNEELSDQANGASR